VKSTRDFPTTRGREDEGGGDPRTVLVDRLIGGCIERADAVEPLCGNQRDAERSGEPPHLDDPTPELVISVKTQGGCDCPQRAGPDNGLTVRHVAWDTIRRYRGHRPGTGRTPEARTVAVAVDVGIAEL
jgi:hypothetical protein